MENKSAPKMNTASQKNAKEKVFIAKDKAVLLHDALLKIHPDAVCELDFGTPFQLLVAVILSAQCTDKRVNMVTEKLFQIYKTPYDFAALSQTELEPHIFSCGFYRNKAKNIISCAKDICEKFAGEVPNDYDSLLTLAGVGRKTANVVWAEAFKGNAIAVDTHVFRVSNRMGLSHGNTPEKVEKDLMELFPEELWSTIHLLLVFQGRYVCKSQNPACSECGVTEFCEMYQKNQKQ